MHIYIFFEQQTFVAWAESPSVARMSLYFLINFLEVKKMKRQKLFAILTAVALIFTSFGCKNDDGSNDSGDSSQPEYVGKIYLETKARPRYIVAERTEESDE